MWSDFKPYQFSIMCRVHVLIIKKLLLVPYQSILNHYLLFLSLPLSSLPLPLPPPPFPLLPPHSLSSLPPSPSLPYSLLTELDYIFGHFTGILLVSTFWFVVYSVYTRNKPKVYPKVILPALASGIIWGIAMSESCDYHVTVVMLLPLH